MICIIYNIDIHLYTVYTHDMDNQFLVGWKDYFGLLTVN